MKIVFLDAKTIGDDIDLSGYEALGEVIKYGFSTAEEAAERAKDADVLVINKVEINEKEVKIDVSIIVKYGAKIPEVATRIQEKITADVESMTGFKVVSVNVKVQGVEDNTESEIEKSSEDIAKNETTEEE